MAALCNFTKLWYAELTKKPVPSTQPLKSVTVIHVFITKIRAGKLSQFKAYYDKLWPEAVNSLTSAGIKRVEIFCIDDLKNRATGDELNTLVMNVEQPSDMLKPGADAGKHWEAIMNSELYEGWKPLKQVYSNVM